MRSTDLVVVSPVFDDWEAVAMLLPILDQELAACGATARVLLVDDGSIQCAPPSLVRSPLGAITEVRVLSLRRNVGHQRALAVGLAYIHDKMTCDAVVVMDSDGEDDPQDIRRLLAELERQQGRSIIFARRARRSEGIVFTALYRLYRGVHRLMTGIPVQVGNFSVVPFALLRRLVVMSDLWNHYAAAVFQSRIVYGMVPTARARRLAGRSRMNFVALVAHGLSAIAVFADRVGVRLLITAIAALGVTLAIVVGATAVWFLTGRAPAGWLVAAVIVGLVLVVQTVGAASLFVLQVLFARATAAFIPSRDYPFFVDSDEPIWRRAAGPV